MKRIEIVGLVLVIIVPLLVIAMAIAAHADTGGQQTLMIIYPRANPDYPHYAVADAQRCAEIQKMSLIEQLFVEEADGLPREEIGRIECQCFTADDGAQSQLNDDQSHFE